jgi:hypothetical protein
MAEREQSDDSERSVQKQNGNQSFPVFDLISEWRAQLDLLRPKDTPEPAGKEVRAAVEPNKWTSAPGPTVSRDNLSLTAEYALQPAEFY